MRDAKHKAMASYSTLTVKVFGNTRIRTSLKMALMRSLVLSRSCFNLHISVPRPWLFETLEQCAHARLETNNWKHRWVDTDGVGETDAGRTKHRLYGQSETQILALCQSPYLEQG